MLATIIGLGLVAQGAAMVLACAIFYAAEV